ncbi:hypothetical protein QZH56_26060 [Streptomyces olivoreticuli]|uniref:DUF6879 family protein n=1 Tax=Streptomyces olivoreticuli TaxID=68246 RepID=UPI00265A5FA3|nr:DUF6879 family protein [Streptomyces olivoreticuli]WKK22238.1 hypothetical protein QZH56_26060 [Streptomyces olivoreticuli]
MLLDGDVWAAYFRDFRRSAWRLEVQPTYTMPAEAGSLARFLRGEPKPDDHNTKWHVTVQAASDAGKTFGRVRVVRQPLTDYQRYQFAWGIPGNIEAGEDIRVLDLTDRDPGLPDQDFWLFDETTVVHLNYRPDGTQINRELIESPDLGKYLGWRNVALENAVPFGEYRA